MSVARPLKAITREVLEPVWSRRDIPLERIAQRLGVTRQGLSYRAKTLGLPSRKGNQECKKKVDDETFARMWMAGVSTKDMAKVMGYTHRGAICRRRFMLGLPPRTRGKGVGNHGGWKETITLAQFSEMELARLMAGRA